MEQPAPSQPPTRPRAVIVLVIGAVIALVPFAIQSASHSQSTMNGELVSSTYRDWVAVVGGAVAAAFAIAFLALGRPRALAFLGGAVLVAALAGYHVARGFGVFWKPEVQTANTTPPVEQPAPPVAAPAPPARAADPATCPDINACDNLASDIQEEDPAGALVAWTRACELGGTYDCTRAGRGTVEKDPAKAMTYWLKGCERKDQDACILAGELYVTGAGIPADPARGRPLLEKACEARALRACKDLANVYIDGIGVAVDLAKAVDYAKRACGDGSYNEEDAPEIAWACDYVGVALNKAEGANADPKGAVAYFDKACRTDPVKCFNLGVAVAEGLGTERNAELARTLYGKACTAGHMLACNNLGVLLEDGLGGPKDPAQAKALFKRACDGGVKRGCENLKDQR